MAHKHSVIMQNVAYIESEKSRLCDVIIEKTVLMGEQVAHLYQGTVLLSPLYLGILQASCCRYVMQALSFE
jgi:hypothetical protein